MLGTVLVITWLICLIMFVIELLNAPLCDENERPIEKDLD